MADTKALVLTALILFTLLCIGAIAVPYYLVALRRQAELDDKGGPEELLSRQPPLATRTLAQGESYYVPPIESAEIRRPTTWVDLLSTALVTIAGAIACFAHLGVMLVALFGGPLRTIALIALGLALYSLLVGALTLLSWRRHTKQLVFAGWILAMVVGNAVIWNWPH